MTRTLFVFPTAKVYPTDLENTISKIPGILETAVVGIPDHEHEGFTLPICFVVKGINETEESIIEKIKELCYNIYPEYSQPKRIYIRESLPLTKVGKIDYLALERIANCEFSNDFCNTHNYKKREDASYFAHIDHNVE